MLIFTPDKPPYSDDYNIFVEEFRTLSAGLPFDDSDVEFWLDRQGLCVRVIDDKKCVVFK
jgi:hypothetical protein